MTSGFSCAKIWTRDNLTAKKYSDGSTISGVYVINGNEDNAAIYGRLYTWPAAMNSASSSDEIPSGIQGACPGGWHLPGDAEWQEMEIYLGFDKALKIPLQITECEISTIEIEQIRKEILLAANYQRMLENVKLEISGSNFQKAVNTCEKATIYYYDNNIARFGLKNKELIDNILQSNNTAFIKDVASHFINTKEFDTSV